MIRRMQTATWHRRTIQRDRWGAELESWPEIDAIEIALAVSNGSTESMNSVLSIQSTHVGITKDNRPSGGDKIVIGNHTYKVDFVIDGCRYRQLMLTECDGL